MQKNLEGLKVLVTGGTGFIGSALVKYLRAHRNVVYIMTTRSSLVDESGFYISADLSIDEMTGVLSEIRPDLIFHLATRYIADHQSQDVQSIIDANIEFGLRLLEAMSKSGCRHLVNVGSSWQYATCNSPNHDPVNLYAASKNAFECFIDYYVKASSLIAMTIILYDSYGPYDKRPKLINKLLESQFKRETIGLSPGYQCIKLVYILDLIQAMIFAGLSLRNSHQAIHKKYCLGNVPQYTLREIASAIEEITNDKLDIVWGEKPYRAREVMQPWHAGMPLPGWSPAISLKDGLRQTWLSFLS